MRSARRFWLHATHLLLLCVVALHLLTTSSGGTTATATSAASQPPLNTEPVLTIGRCVVHAPVAFAFDCQLAAFGGYLPQQQQQLDASIDTALRKRVRVASDAAMLACSDDVHTTSDLLASSSVLSEDEPQSVAMHQATADASIVLVRRGACTFEHKLQQVVATSAHLVHAMVLINTDDLLLSMGSLEYEYDNDPLVRHAIAVAVTRTDGERLLQLVRDDYDSPVELSLTATAHRADQVQQRIAFHLHANAVALAVATFHDALPASLRDVDALVCALTHAASLSHNTTAEVPPCRHSVEWHDSESDSERSHWLALIAACLQSFPTQTEAARSAALHAAAAAAWLLATAPVTVAALADASEYDDVYQLAALKLTDAGYYDASAFCLDQAERHAVNHSDDDRVSAIQCQRALVTFLQGDVVASVAIAKRCLDTGVGSVTDSIASVRVASETLTRLAALDMAPRDLECLRQSVSGDSDDDALDVPCCMLQTCDADSSSTTTTTRHRQQPLAFRSRAVHELFDALNVMGVFLDELGAFRESLQFFGHAARLCPHDVSLQLRQVLAVPVVLDSSAAIAAFYTQLATDIRALAADANANAVAIAQQPEDATYLQFTITPPTMFIGYQGVDVLPIQRAIFALRTQLFPSLQASSSPLDRPAALSQSLQRPRRRTVAFISTWFRSHSVGKLVLGVVERLDRVKFHVLVFRCTHFLRNRDAMTDAFERAADAFVDLPSRRLDALAVLRDAAIDVVVFPELGMDAWTVALAHTRVAPVQCVFWGHPITTANPAVDYFVSSEYFAMDDTPLDVNRDSSDGNSDIDVNRDSSDDDLAFRYHGARFSEQVVLFRGLSTFFTRPNVSRRDAHVTRRMLELPENRRLYVCPQTLMKFHPAFDRALAGILQQDPRATIVLLASESQRVWTEQLQRRFRRVFGSDAARRVLFVPTLPYAEFMALLSFADVVLDPFPFGGGVTTLDALALGIPVVTLPAAQTVPQLAAGFLRYMNVTDTIVRSVDAFVAVAVAVAADVDGVRARLQHDLLQRHDLLYEDAASVDDWNAFLEYA